MKRTACDRSCGVVKDYHFASLKKRSLPKLFSMDSTTVYGQLWVKVRSQKYSSQRLLRWKLLTKNYGPFSPILISFMDEINAKNYETEAKWKQIISIASGLFISFHALDY
jgi:putative ABC transport system permease protein